MMHYIINDITWHQHEVTIQINISFDGATSPKSFLSFNSNCIVAATLITITSEGIQ